MKIKLVHCYYGCLNLKPQLLECISEGTSIIIGLCFLPKLAMKGFGFQSRDNTLNPLSVYTDWQKVASKSSPSE